MRQCTRVGVAGLLGLALVLGAGGAPSAFAAAAWTIDPSPSPVGAVQGELNGVACLTPTNCTAVGESGVDPDNWSGGATLIERWNGTAWTIVRSPNPLGASESVLYSVACPTATRCLAVGVSKYVSGGAYTYSTLVERWNGKAWRVVASPSPTGAWNSVLEAVACTSATSCNAVGYSADAADPNTATSLVEHWNGTAWTIVASPNPSGAGIDTTILTGVSCTAADNCTAVGTARFTPTPSTERYDTLVEQWDGTAWTIVASPTPSAPRIPSWPGCRVRRPPAVWPSGATRRRPPRRCSSSGHRDPLR